MNTPDLSLYLIAHRRMRQSSAQLAAALVRLDERERRDRGRQLVRWYAGFEGELQLHHTLEDTIYFPALFTKVPALRGYLDRIDEEHRYLTELMTAARTALAAIDDPLVPFDTAASDAIATADELAALLDRHLDFEDAEVLPLFTRHMDGNEYTALEESALGTANLTQLRYTVPWLMAGADPDEQRHMLDGSPFIMKVLWIATRRGYAKLEGAAMGSAATSSVAVTS